MMLSSAALATPSIESFLDHLLVHNGSTSNSTSTTTTTTSSMSGLVLPDVVPNLEVQDPLDFHVRDTELCI